MDCPRCGIPNGDDRRFCSACGGRLTVVCRDCGTQNEPPARFCGGCGKALSSPPTAPSRPPLHDIERRQLTVMFCDLGRFDRPVPPSSIRKICATSCATITSKR